jgi:hypothetical protein
MMKSLTELFRRFDSRRAQEEIDEELRLHLDLLTEEHWRQDVPWEEAQATAVKRFGNLERIRDECVRIARRNHPRIQALKWFFGLVFVTGVLVRVFSPEYHLTRVGDMLIAAGILSRLLLYVRGMNSSTYVSKPVDASPLKLNDSRISLVAYDQRRRTPLERIISNK